MITISAPLFYFLIGCSIAWAVILICWLYDIAWYVFHLLEPQFRRGVIDLTKGK